MLPKISIVTASFNQGQFIEETICSVLDQGYPNLEYIIIDGGSTDKSVEIIKKYENHLTYWVTEKDKGQSDAINKGFRRATGDVINWLNSDDYYYMGALKSIGERFADPNVNVYCGTSRVFSTDEDERFTNGTDIYEGNLEKTIGWARIDQPETFFRKSQLDKIGYLDEQFHYIMDKEMWIRYLMQYGLEGVIKDSNPIANFRIHGNSKTSQFQERFHEETKRLFYSIAKLNGSGLSNLRGYWPPKEFDLKYKEPLLVGKSMAEKVVTYSMYYQFEEAYALNKFSEAKKIAGMIRAENLNGEDAEKFTNIKNRMKVPPFVKKIVNKLR